MFPVMYIKLIMTDGGESYIPTAAAIHMLDDRLVL